MSRQFPQDWLAKTDVMFFLTSEECCDTHFKTTNCVVYDHGCRIDDPEQVCGDVFHPDINAAGCSNSAKYPKSWEGNGDFLFTSFQACCEQHHEESGRCEVRFPCTGEVLELQITAKPTEEPTKKPTKQVRRYACLSRQNVSFLVEARVTAFVMSRGRWSNCVSRETP